METQKAQAKTSTVDIQRIGLWVGALTLIVACPGAIIPGYVPDILTFRPTLAQGFGGLIIVMVLTMLVLYEYMSRKSDVE